MNAQITKALKEAAQTGDPVEILGQRTETSQVFANPTGTLTEERYASAQWVRKSGKLVDIDTTLQAAADGRFAAKAAEIGISFSGGGSGPLATLTRDGRSMSLSWPTPLPEPEVTADTATYPDVLPDVDLKLRATPSGIGQLLVVKTPEAATNPELASLQYGLASDGLEIQTDDHDNLRAINPATQEVFTGPAPRMWDSTQTPLPSLQETSSPSAAEDTPPADEFIPAPGAKQAPVPMTVDDKALALTPDQELLTDEDTQYPVYIDPYIDGSRYSWTIAYKKYPNTSFYNGAGWIESDGSKGTTTARAGYENETNGLARSYFRMNTKNLWSTDKQVISSTFRIKNTWSWSCTKKPLQLWRSATIGSATTWNNQPDLREQLDTVTDAKGWSGSCPAGNLAFDTTAAAKDAASNHWNTISLMLRAGSETDVYGWKKFSAKSAVLSTEYNTRPDVPSALDTSPISTRNSSGCGDVAPYGLIGNTDFYLTAKGGDKDGGTVTVRFHLWATGHHDDGAGVFIDKTVNVTSGTVAKLKIAKSDLTPHLATASGNFSWKAQASDGKLTSDWNPTLGAPGCRFVFDPDRPSTPPITSSSEFPDGSTGWPVNTSAVRTEGTFTFDSAGVSDTVSYKYWSDTDPTPRTIENSTPGGTASVKMTPTTVGANRLYVQSVDQAGNLSDTAVYLYYANGMAQADAPGDINGDGHPDMWAIDGSGDLHRFYGSGDGKVAEASAIASNTTWNNTKITHRGDWTGDGYEDLIALRHDEALNSDRLWLHPNDGYGFACTACSGSAGAQQELAVYEPENNHWQGAQDVLAVGDVDGPLDTDGDGAADTPGYPDLLIRNGDQLWLYYGAPDNHLDSEREPLLIGESGWTDTTLFAPGDYNNDGHIDLGSRNLTTGEVFLHQGKGPNGDGLADHTTKINVGSTFTAANAPLFTSPGDADHDRTMDAWIVHDDGNLWCYPGNEILKFMVSSGWSDFQVIS